MQNHEGSVLCTPMPVKRQTITVSLQPETIKRLDVLAKRSERSRSNLISLMLDGMLLIVSICDAPKL